MDSILQCCTYFGETIPCEIVSHWMERTRVRSVDARRPEPSNLGLSLSQSQNPPLPLRLFGVTARRGARVEDLLKSALESSRFLCTRKYELFFYRLGVPLLIGLLLFELVKPQNCRDIRDRDCFVILSPCRRLDHRLERHKLTIKGNRATPTLRIPSEVRRL